jgi:hypothetical protein
LRPLSDGRAKLKTKEHDARALGELKAFAFNSMKSLSTGRRNSLAARKGLCEEA